MTTEIQMPALSPTMEEGALAKWLVQEGDTVSAGDVIAEVETDKATLEIEAPCDGQVSRIFVPAGSGSVPVGTPIAVLNEGPNTVAVLPLVEPLSDAAAVAPPCPQQGVFVQETEANIVSADHSRSSVDISISPLARKMAQLAGIDLAGLSDRARLGRADIERALGKGAAVLTSAPARTMPSVRQAPGPHDLIPLDGMRKTIARRMTESFRDVPHFPISVDVEIDYLLQVRAELNARIDTNGIKISINDLLIRACAVALKHVPDANVSYTPEAIVRHHGVNIAVAVAVEGGLVAPVLRAADSKGLLQISAEMKVLAEQARSRDLLPQDYAGGTFTLSNLGMREIKSFSSILNEPQAMILSVGAGLERPVVRNGKIAIGTIMNLTLTCDHRAVDGAVAAFFLTTLRRFIENPLSMV